MDRLLELIPFRVNSHPLVASSPSSPRQRVVSIFSSLDERTERISFVKNKNTLVPKKIDERIRENRKDGGKGRGGRGGVKFQKLDSVGLRSFVPRNEEESVLLSDYSRIRRDTRD